MPSVSLSSLVSGFYSNYSSPAPSEKKAAYVSLSLGCLWACIVGFISLIFIDSTS